MTVFYAQPYDISACGFYFSDMEEYDTKYFKCRNSFGGQVEEFEIQFIDGESIDAQLFEALGIHQGNISNFIDAIDEWEDHEKQALIIAVGECGYDFDITDNDLSVIENVDIYYVDSLRDLAESFVYEGLYGEIPDTLQFYIDYDAIARDLSVDFSEIVIDDTRIVYACS
ncbi:MAG: antirestriction protein ArdA [Nitrosomonas sp.]|nr:antirestriction protein ArdA [Nitrosomonas sp.]